MAEQRTGIGNMVLRLPPELKERLRQTAFDNRRSMTREIQVAVERHLRALATD